MRRSSRPALSVANSASAMVLARKRRAASTTAHRRRRLRSGYMARVAAPLHGECAAVSTSWRPDEQARRLALQGARHSAKAEKRCPADGDDGDCPGTRPRPTAAHKNIWRLSAATEGDATVRMPSSADRNTGCRDGPYLLVKSPRGERHDKDGREIARTEARPGGRIVKRPARAEYAASLKPGRHNHK